MCELAGVNFPADSPRGWATIEGWERLDRLALASLLRLKERGQGDPETLELALAHLEKRAKEWEKPVPQRAREIDDRLGFFAA